MLTDECRLRTAYHVEDLQTFNKEDMLIVFDCLIWYSAMLASLKNGELSNRYCEAFIMMCKVVPDCFTNKYGEL